MWQSRIPAGRQWWWASPLPRPIAGTVAAGAAWRIMISLATILLAPMGQPLGAVGKTNDTVASASLRAHRANLPASGGAGCRRSHRLSVARRQGEAPRSGLAADPAAHGATLGPC